MAINWREVFPISRKLHELRPAQGFAQQRADPLHAFIRALVIHEHRAAWSDAYHFDGAEINVVTADSAHLDDAAIERHRGRRAPAC